VSTKLIRFKLNGAPVSARVRPSDTLVEVLTAQFDLKGARESCGQGLCGCCTVYVDDKPISGCLFLAVFADGTSIVTVEGLADSHRLDPVQQAFIEAGAFQCGFCTPGFILMTKKLLELHPHPTDEQIRHYLSGNLCRCAAYPEIMQAVRLAEHGRGA
jgi:carbon-monoxide dehydrogenase small subunit